MDKFVELLSRSAAADHSRKGFLSLVTRYTVAAGTAGLGLVAAAAPAAATGDRTAELQRLKDALARRPLNPPVKGGPPTITRGGTAGPLVECPHWNCSAYQTQCTVCPQDCCDPGGGFLCCAVDHCIIGAKRTCCDDCPGGVGCHDEYVCVA